MNELIERTREFIRSTVLPFDDEFDGDIEAVGGEALREKLQAAVREQGVFAPHVPTVHGGLGLDMVAGHASVDDVVAVPRSGDRTSQEWARGTCLG